MIELPLDNVMDRSPEVWDQIWLRAEINNRTEYGFVDPVYTDDLAKWALPYIGPAAWENSETLLARMLVVMRHYWWLSYVVVACYLIAIPVGQRIMKNRPAFNLKKPLALWNLFLANSDKYFELIDTAFLVLRKKNVNFLHWFHHATVLLYCWHAGAYEQPTGIFFATMNYMVHSIMYFYYFLSSVGHKPKWGLTVTILQITQMLIGMFVVAVHYYSLRTVPRCDGATEDLLAAFLMYTAYLVLFAQFFVGRYVKGGNRKAKKDCTGKAAVRPVLDQLVSLGAIDLTGTGDKWLEELQAKEQKDFELQKELGDKNWLVSRVALVFQSQVQRSTGDRDITHTLRFGDDTKCPLCRQSEEVCPGTK
ncbi:hypothetical protein FOZ63_032338, partial [Perkinsus olseni]